MEKQMLGEFLGTMILILLGNGVVANVLLRKSKAENGGWMVIATGWAFAVMAGIFTASATGSLDAHLSPAVTLGFAVSSGDFSKLAYYIPAQIAGAFVGATLVWLHFYPHWVVTPDADAKQGCFCTAPAIRNLPFNVLSEVLGTFVLIVVVGAIGSNAAKTAQLSLGHGPYLVACVVWGIGLSLGGTTGYAINPARDLGPRLAHALLPIAGKGSSGWNYALVPIVGPLAGAALAGLLMRLINF